MAPFKITSAAIEDGAVGANQVDPSLGFFPTGGIIMWSGSIASIPNGWYLCNGQTVGSLTTPDLRNRFIVAAADDDGTGQTFNANSGAVSGNYAPGDTGGETAHQMTINEMPNHSHPYTNGDAYWVLDAGTTQNEGFTSGSNEFTTRTGVNGQGSDDYHENRPLYYALAFIMKI